MCFYLLLQRCEVVIDACMLGASDSAFLQQAAHLTNGIYLRPKHKDALLQYLLVCTPPNLSDPSMTAPK